LPLNLMFSSLAMTDLSGSRMYTMPEKSSLNVYVLHEGHCEYFDVIKWQFLQAFSFAISCHSCIII
jgi:hypothetical protein